MISSLVKFRYWAVLALAWACIGHAQDTAPASLAGKTAVVVISSGTGDLAPIGGFRIAFAAAAPTYTLRPLSALVVPSTGTYSYSRTSANSARIALNDTEVGVAITQSLVFTSPTTATYSVTTPQGNQTGTFVLEDVTVVSGGVVQTSGGLVNLSVRAQIPNGSQVIPGLVVDAPTRVLVRVGGPALAAFGVRGTLPNPRLVVYSGMSVIAGNDDWSSSAVNAAEVSAAARRAGAFDYAQGSLDAAVVLDLAVGSYTILIAGEAGTSGEVLVEVFKVPR